MAVPKRKKSKSKVRSRRRSHAHAREIPAPLACSECGAPRLPHRVCPSCGTYRGRQVITIETEE